MKNKFLFLVGILFLLILNFSFSIADEGCYVALDFNISENDSVVGVSQDDFGFVKLKSLYGDYSFLVNSYNQSENNSYVLVVYSSAGQNNFSFDPYYSFVKNNNSDFSIVIPYVNPLELNDMVIYFDNREIYRFLPSGISCNRDCISVKEFSNVSGRCCEGLTKSFLYNNTKSFTCTNCGDGVCGRYESSLTCLSDCPRNITYNCSEGFVVSKYGCVEGNICGNDVIDSGESCDDGNNQSADGCNSVCEIEGACADSDDKNVFTKGYFRYNCSGDDCGDGSSGGAGEDICLDSQILLENYCGYNFRWDFWNMDLEQKTFTQTCQYGCEYGRCLTAEEIIEPPVLDLPDEPVIPTSGLG